LTHLLEDKFGIDISFYLLPEAAADLRTKVSLMVSSGDLPEILLAGSLTNEQILDYGSKGAFIPLNKYLEDPAKTPNYSKIPEEHRQIVKDTSYSADGNIYALPRFEIETRNLTPHWIFFNKVWADKLGVPIPKTTEDLKRALIAFRDRDPNGNGKKDEIGLYAWYNGGFGEDLITALLNAFIFYNKNYLSLDASGNKVIAPFTDPAFRKGLQYLRSLYDEGVLAASSFTDDQTTYRSVVNITPHIVGITSAGMWNHWPNADNNPNFREFQMIPPLTGPDGVSWTPYNGYNPAKVGFITSKAKDPDFAFEFLESFYSTELSTITRYGIEEEDWTRDPVKLATMTNIYLIMGLYPSLTIATMSGVWSEPSNHFWHNMTPRWAPTEEADRKGQYSIDPFNPNQPTAPVKGINYQHYMNRHPAKILPNLKYNIDDARTVAEPITNVNEFVRQAVAEFTTGIRDINNDSVWNQYLRELNNMGLQTWLTIAQRTYDRQK
jgi:putative aldouronate transport system substrate-binding protein